MLEYGRNLEKAAGGVPVPVSAMFLQGLAHFFCFPSLNTYYPDVVRSKGRSAEVVAENHTVRDLFETAGSAAVCCLLLKRSVFDGSTL
jgi:hypothetical protein